MFQRITNIRKNSKEWWEGDKDGFFLASGAFLVILLVGGIFRLLILWQVWSPIALVERGEKNLTQEYMVASGFPGLVAASRNGTRYYYPWCGGLSRIKEANKVWFKTVEAAEQAGYAIASGCERL